MRRNLSVLAALLFALPVLAAERTADTASSPFRFDANVEEVRLTFASPDGNNSPESYVQVELTLDSGVKTVICDQRITEHCAALRAGDHVSVSATIIPCVQCLRLGLGQNLVLAHSVTIAE